MGNRLKAQYNLYEALKPTTINCINRHRLKRGIPRVISIKDRLFFGIRIGHKARLRFNSNWALFWQWNRASIIKKIEFQYLVIDVAIGEIFEILPSRIVN